jgi:GTP-binding protein EngB required for normal cell division
LKKKISFFILTVVLAITCVTGCSSSRKDDAINELLSKESNTYAGYLFWNSDSDVKVLNEELLNIVNSERVMQSLRFSKMDIISMNDKNQNMNYVKLFDIQNSPTLLIFDTKKLVLQTNNLKDLYNLADKLKEPL